MVLGLLDYTFIAILTVVVTLGVNILVYVGRYYLRKFKSKDSKDDLAEQLKDIFGPDSDITIDIVDLKDLDVDSKDDDEDPPRLH